VEILVFILFRILFNKMKHITEIILATLIVGCLITLIVILTNSCKNAGFRLKQSFSTPTPTVLDNLAIFTNGQNTELQTVLNTLQAEVKEGGLVINKVLVCGPLPSKSTGIDYTHLDLTGLVVGNNISWAPELRNEADSQFSRCLNSDTTLLELSQCYLTTIKDNKNFPIFKGINVGDVTLYGFTFSSEREGKVLCNLTVSFNMSVVGIMKSLDPGLKIVGMEQTGYMTDDQLSKWNNMTISKFCADPTRPKNMNGVVDDWFTEDTYEPGKLRGLKSKTQPCDKWCPPPAPAPPAPPKCEPARTKCCDSTTSCPNIANTPCKMLDPDGWAAQVFSNAGVNWPPTGTPFDSIHNKYVTIGISHSNADCLFDSTDDVSKAITLMGANGVKNICLYSR
jgi:hypothetical protein